MLHFLGFSYFAIVIRVGKTSGERIYNNLKVPHCRMLTAYFLRIITARHFITRALLGAENFVQAQTILRDNGVGAGNGCSINMTFLRYFFFVKCDKKCRLSILLNRQEGDRLFHNAEMGPAEKGTNQSQLNIFTASPGEHIIHANK